MPEKINFVDKVLARIDRLDRSSVQSYLSSLVREKKQIEQILDQVNEGLLILDREGQVKFANRRAFLWLGFQRFFKDRSLVVDLVGEPLLKRFLLDRLKRPDQISSNEFDVLTPRPLSLRLHWIPLESENSQEILLRIENISQEKEKSEEESRLQRTEGLIRLASGIAHEIGNPLNSIQIHIDLLKRELTSRPKAKQEALNKLVEVLSTETKRLDQIVRSFLRATRRPPLRFRKESLNEILEEAVKFFQPEMKRAKVHPRLTLDESLPSFLVDRDRLHQAFVNLIKNAVEAMPQGGDLIISTKFKEKICWLQFEDQGSGIDEKHLPHIFEAYYTTKEQGSGLGLSQVYETVREHGGRIDVKSTAGKGSVFTLAFPVRQERLSLPQLRPKEETR